MDADLKPLSGQVALITAGSRGLGAEITRQLAAAGADVAYTYLKDTDAAAALARELRELGRRALPLQADAREFSRAQEVVAECERQLGALSILVCCAGMARPAPLHLISEKDWDDVLAGSLKSTFNYLRAAGPGFIQRRRGKVVCIGSINGLRGRVGTASYNAAKAGLIGLMKTAAAEWGRHDINVNLIAPGFIETTTQINTPELIRDVVLKECAIKRLGTPGDIAPLVVFLCGEGARHITGQVIKVDAGQYL